MCFFLVAVLYADTLFSAVKKEIIQSNCKTTNTSDISVRLSRL